MPCRNCGSSDLDMIIKQIQELSAGDIYEHKLILRRDAIDIVRKFQQAIKSKGDVM